MNKLINKIEINLQSHYGIVIAVMLGGIAFYYLMLIKWLPGFITDDYYIFYLIDRNPHSIFVSNTTEKFYLFYRPISYLYFWILYTIFGNNPAMMKVAILILLLIAIFLSVSIVNHFARYFQVNISLFVVFLTSLFVAFHPDIIQSVLWISNANELLMITFYLVTLYYVSGILIGKFSPNIIIIGTTSLAFFLSVLSKQQSLHFPLLLSLFLILVGKNIEQDRKRTLWAIVGITMAIMIVVLTNNAVLFLSRESSKNVIIALWKKPFALLGTSLYVLFPLYGLEIYSFFLLHKTYALAIAILSIFPLFVFLKKYNLPIKNIFICLLVISVIYFPRILLPGTDRINVIQIFYLSLFIPIFVSKFHKRYLRIALGIVLFGILGGLQSFHTLSQEIDYANKMDLELKSYLSAQPPDTYVLAYSDPLCSSQNSLYYTKTGRFGVDSTIIRSGVNVLNDLKGFKKISGIQTSVKKDLINIHTMNNLVGIYLDKLQKQPVVIDSVVGMRGYSSLSFKLPHEIATRKPSILIYSDSGWVKLK